MQASPCAHLSHIVCREQYTPPLNEEGFFPNDVTPSYTYKTHSEMTVRVKVGSGGALDAAMAAHFGAQDVAESDDAEGDVAFRVGLLSLPEYLIVDLRRMTFDFETFDTVRCVRHAMGPHSILRAHPPCVAGEEPCTVRVSHAVGFEQGDRARCVQASSPYGRPHLGKWRAP